MRTSFVYGVDAFPLWFDVEVLQGNAKHICIDGELQGTYIKSFGVWKQLKKNDVVIKHALHMCTVEAGGKANARFRSCKCITELCSTTSASNLFSSRLYC